MVRFGNVLASSGSVVPLFKTNCQGRPTLTHKIWIDISTITEAIQLVLIHMAEEGMFFYWIWESL